MSEEVQGHDPQDSPNADGACGKRSWWHKHEVFACIEATLSAQDVAGESSLSERKVMMNERYLAIAQRMLDNGEWECASTPEQSDLVRCVDVVSSGSKSDSAVHRKFTQVTRECTSDTSCCSQT